jgi:hypothetical protein
MRIGIWGNYNYGNFGDDLMAVSIAIYLLNKGHIPVVYRLNKEISKQFDIETENSINDFVSNVDFCLIGGGGMLVGNSWLKRTISITAKRFEIDFKELLEAITDYKKEIYPISIGGEAKKSAPFSKYRNQFFKSQYLKKGTVRLDGDLLLILL